MSSSSSAMADTMNPSAKRKRSLSPAHPPAPIKVAKTHSSHLQINYLTRQYSDILPLVAPDDPLPSLLSLIQDYDGVLQRHESMAGNLGARPLGPMLIKRFDRLFEGPPRVLKTHGKEGTTVGWLDVVEFARNKPEQFNLEKTRDGLPVCQFYTKQCRVEITEEDYELIASGMPQRLIPPQPILEDEEKELGTLEILEKNLGNIVQLADQVSARARQLNHRLKNRKNAIIARRESEAISSNSTRSPTTNGTHNSVSPSSGFVAVNAPSPDTYGTSAHTASAATRAELLSKFFTTSERVLASSAQESRPPHPASLLRTGTNETVHLTKPKFGSGSTQDGVDYANRALLASMSPGPIPKTPSALVSYNKATPTERFDDPGPYKAEMVSRMDQLQRGDRIVPPCDRCRRLHMDCYKNLTACLGCTKKHAKCSWKDVEEEELRNYEPPPPRQHIDEEDTSEESASTGPKKKEYKREGQGVADEELLGEESSSSDADEPNSNYLSSPRSQEPIQIHVAGTLASKASTTPDRHPITPPDKIGISALDGTADPPSQPNDPLPSPPGAPIPQHAELAKIPAEIEKVEEVQASRVPDPMTDIQPTIEAHTNGFTTVNGFARDTDCALDATNDQIWAQAPPTPPSPPAAPVMPQAPFKDEGEMDIKVVPVADMGQKAGITEI